MVWFFGHRARDLSSPIRGGAHTSCTGRGRLNHWTTREGPTACSEEQCIVPMASYCQRIRWYSGLADLPFLNPPNQ